jgi:hypothetical protein
MQVTQRILIMNFRFFPTLPEWRRQYQTIVKSKAILVAGRGGLQRYEMLRIPHCLDSWLTDGGKLVSPTHRPRFTPEKHYLSASGTNFCYRLSKAQGLVRAGRIR